MDVTESDVRNLLSTNMRRLRKQMGLSQLKLANELQMAMTFISDIENGKKWVSPETLSRFANFFNVPVAELFLSEKEKLIREEKSKEKNTEFNTCAFVSSIEEEVGKAVDKVCRKFGLSK